MSGNKGVALAWLAESYVGTVETRPNGGPMVERFQKAVDGKAAGEPWCVSFVMFCVMRVDELFARLGVTSQSHKLPPTEWSVGLYRMTPEYLRRTIPRVGDIAVWQKIGSENGHAGIVVNPAEIITVEANTSPGLLGDQREGDGVWMKRRPKGELPGFNLLGYLGAWG